VSEGQDTRPGAAESQVGAGFAAMAAGNWCGARDAFAGVLAVTEVPEALFGMASALFWLGDIAGTIANCEKAYAAFRRRGDAMFAAGAALSLVGYNKGYLGNTAAARGWLSRATRIIEAEVPALRGELLGATAFVTDDPVLSEALAREAADIGRANGNSDLELMAMHAVGQALPYAMMLKMIPMAASHARVPEDRRAELLADLRNNDPAIMQRIFRGYLSYLNRSDAPEKRLCAAGVPAWVVHAEKGDGGLTAAERSTLEECPHTSVITIPGTSYSSRTRNPNGSPRVSLRHSVRPADLTHMRQMSPAIGGIEAV
jgi:hypothetical protein